MYHRILPLLSTAASTESSVDVLSLMFAYSVDVISSYIFGLSRGTCFIQDSNARRSWRTIYLQSHSSDALFWEEELPNLTRWLNSFGIPVLSKSYKSAKRELGQWALNMVDSTEMALDQSLNVDGLPPDQFPSVYHQLRNAMAKENAHLEKPFSFLHHRLALASELLDHVNATADIFGTFLCLDMLA